MPRSRGPPLQPAPLARRRDEPSGSRRRRVGAGHCCQADAARCPGGGRGPRRLLRNHVLCVSGFCGHKFPSPAGKDGAVTPEKGGNLQPPSRLGPEPRGLAGPGRSAGGAGQGWRPASAGRAGLWARGAAPTACRSSLSPGASSRDTGQGRPLPSSSSGPPDPTLGVHGAGRDRAARPRAGGGRGRRTGIEVLHAGGPPGTSKNARVQAADGIPPSKEPALGLRGDRETMRVSLRERGRRGQGARCGAPRLDSAKGEAGAAVVGFGGGAGAGRAWGVHRGFQGRKSPSMTLSWRTHVTTYLTRRQLWTLSDDVSL